MVATGSNIFNDPMIAPLIGSCATLLLLLIPYFTRSGGLTLSNPYYAGGLLALGAVAVVSAATLLVR